MTKLYTVSEKSNWSFPLFLLAIIMVSCGGKSTKDNKKDKNTGPVSIDVSVAKLSIYANEIEANGTVMASEFVELKPEVAGRITYLNIKEGMSVQEGTLLVKLNDEDLQAQLKKFKAQLQLAKNNESRLKIVLKAEGLNQADYDVALQQVNNLEADLEFTQALINKTEIRAPFTGVIGLRNVSKGAFVSQQSILATIQQVQSLKLDFVLPEIYASTVYQGKKVSIINDLGKKFEAVISGVEPQVNTATRNLKIRALISANTKALSPGAFVRVVFNEGESKPRLFVPSNCIIPDTRFKKLAVVKNNAIVMTVVETGIRTGSDVELISGIQAGDTFAVNGILFLKPGTDIKVRKVK
jgi:membrane fusion protein (multidrug efflux system)